MAKNIDFFPSDIDINTAFNEDFKSSQANVKKEYREMFKNLVLDYMKIVPFWSYSVAVKILTIADLEIQQIVAANVVKKLSKSDIGLTKEDTSMLQSLARTIEINKEEIGIDPKSLQERADVSLNACFSDVVSQMEFNPKNSIFKPIWEGIKTKKEQEALEDTAFEKMSENDLDKFLHGATA